MQWRHRLEKIFMHIVDGVFRFLPQPRPPEALLRDCKVIAHRGDHNDHGILENTMAAFARAEDCGVWGIELDVRWTKDAVPVVFHDPNMQRLFGSPAVLADMSFAEMTGRFPMVPSLAQIIARFGKRRHLMIELKNDPHITVATQAVILSDMLSGLRPQTDYHLISLTPHIFGGMQGFSSQTFLPIAQQNIAEVSRMAEQGQYRGLLGHYLLMRRPAIDRHHRIGQAVGTGFIDSRNCLYREVNRRVDWVFSNRVRLLQTIINAV